MRLIDTASPDFFPNSGDIKGTITTLLHRHWAWDAYRLNIGPSPSRLYLFNASAYIGPEFTVTWGEIHWQFTMAVCS